MTVAKHRPRTLGDGKRDSSQFRVSYTLEVQLPFLIGWFKGTTRFIIIQKEPPFFYMVATTFRVHHNQTGSWICLSHPPKCGKKKRPKYIGTGRKTFPTSMIKQGHELEAPVISSTNSFGRKEFFVSWFLPSTFFSKHLKKGQAM